MGVEARRRGGATVRVALTAAYAWGWSAVLLGAGCAAPDCIVVGEPGRATLVCGSLTYDVSRPRECPEAGCGLIVDVHGLTMSGRIQERSTRLGERGPPRGYIVVQPNAPAFAPFAGWEPSVDVEIRAFIELLVEELPIDPARVHMTGFSQGGFMSWRFACQHSDLVASVAPAAAGAGCEELAAWGCLFDEAHPSRPLDVLFMAGVTDALVDFDRCIVPQRESVIEHLGLVERERLEATHHRRVRLASDEAEMIVLEHRYSNSHPVLDGHCFPGSADTEIGASGQAFAFACEQQAAFDWGAEVLDFFDAHPRVHAGGEPP